MGWRSGAETEGSKARSDPKEVMLGRHFKRLLSQLVKLTCSHVPQCIQTALAVYGQS